jgi:hypothetical protein
MPHRHAGAASGPLAQQRRRHPLGGSNRVVGASSGASSGRRRLPAARASVKPVTDVEIRVKRDANP